MLDHYCNEPDPATEPAQTVADLLKQGWCQGTMAQDVQGRTVAVNSKEAVQFCLIGRMARI